MSGNGKVTTAIRLSTGWGVLVLGGIGATLVLLAVGAFRWETGMAVPLALGATNGAVALLTAWGLRRDRDDPDGIERREQRLESASAFLGVALAIAALVAVAAITLWGILGTTT